MDFEAHVSVGTRGYTGLFWPVVEAYRNGKLVDVRTSSPVTRFSEAFHNAQLIARIQTNKNDRD